ncbi:MAG: hypothetical protein CME88_09875 [Hirschia sp.]|nr:hypothetical protein [Hirschia sp.]MBF18675.1 hypothetical protein [Hirschia sp.]
MALDHDLAGIFFADDYVIWGTAKALDRAVGFPDMALECFPDFVNLTSPREPHSRARRFEASSAPLADLGTALDQMSKEIDLQNIGAITTASIGPFEDGKSGLVEGGRIIKGARREGWDQGIDLYGAVKSEFERRIGSVPTIRCLGDTEAHVLGEHYLFRRSNSALAQNKRNAKQMGRDTVAYLMLDEGVGGAVFQRGLFVRGEASLELGHMPVYHRDNRLKPAPCFSHKYSCLEGTIGLPNLRTSWGMDSDEIAKLEYEHDLVQSIAFYIGQAVFQLSVFYAPTVILLGGRVMDHPDLLEMVQVCYELIASNSFDEEERVSLFPNYAAQYDTDEYIKRSTMPDTGVLGCLCWSYNCLDPEGKVAQLSAKRK